MSEREEKQNGWSEWVLPIILLFAFTPMGVLLVVLKLLDAKKGGTGRARRAYEPQRDAGSGSIAGAPAETAAGPVGARTTGGPGRAPARRRGRDPISALAKKGKRLTVLGGILAAVFAAISLSAVGNAVGGLLYGGLWYFLRELLNLSPLLCICGGGLGCLWAGLRKRKQASRWRNYLGMIGTRRIVSVSELAAASDRTAAQVREDLADMLDAGLFPQGFLDYGGDRLVLSGDGLEETPRQAPRAQEAKPSAQEAENAFLTEIRAVNDAIDNEKMSAQIDRIGVITAKILDYQKSHPEKATQLHSFLSYYLPTTLKILRAYGHLEDQEVAGENITAAMGRIEGMMDKVVEGFEKQLDLLFQGDAMDVSADVEVLERMLAKDGLSEGQGLTLNF